ncbi:MAG: nicotinate (nicotinamide) nucleotide adenylyltransferase, partial [Clostridia bacterium]|nr:nicotinate (nicotinamide) nucleotide adenylyltransferase [Clostridia bacterium]
MRIALFGGSFDPIHNGHIQMAAAFVKALSLDRVLFMPTADPPHKLKSDMAAPAHRLAMCRLAVADYPWAEISDLEIQRGGASFTVDTLAALTALKPEAEWFLLTGADMFVTLHSWYRFADIARMATLCTLPRDERDAAVLAEYAARLTAGLQGMPGLITPYVPEDRTSVYHYYRIRFDPKALGINMSP